MPQVIKDKCLVVVRNKNGEVIQEYYQDSEQKIDGKEIDVDLTHSRRQVCGGYRKRKYIYDRYDEWKTSVG